MSTTTASIAYQTYLESAWAEVHSFTSMSEKYHHRFPLYPGTVVIDGVFYITHDDGFMMGEMRKNRMIMRLPHPGLIGTIDYLDRYSFIVYRANSSYRDFLHQGILFELLPIGNYLEEHLETLVAAYRLIETQVAEQPEPLSQSIWSSFFKDNFPMKISSSYTRTSLLRLIRQSAYKRKVVISHTS